MSTGKYQGVDLRGHMPTMMYKEDVTNGFINALQERFNLNPVEKTVISSTKILHFANWPAPGSPEIQGFTDFSVGLFLILLLNCSCFFFCVIEYSY